MRESVRPDISVIVCCHNQDFIHKFVASCQKSEGVHFEIIVVSSDMALCEEGIEDCLVVNGPDLPAAKRNMGARLAKGKYLAFFDDDVEIERNCLMELSSWIGSKCKMVYGKLLKADEPHRFDEAGGFLTSTGFLWSRAGQNEVDNGQWDSKWINGTQILAGKSASCLIDKKVFKEVGGFDEDFGILGEETDLSWRVWLAGYEVHFNSNARGIHYFNTKFKPFKRFYTNSRVYRNGCRNYITMLLKNLEGGSLWKILPVHCLIWLTASIAMCSTGRLSQGTAILSGLWYNLKNLPHVLEKRRKVQESRVRTDRDIWPYIHRRTPRGYYSQRFRRYVSLGLHG